MTIQQDYKAKGYSEAEVEILLSINTLNSKVGAIEKNQLDYIKKSEFDPVQKIVYGLVGVILVAVASGVIAMVLQ